MALLLELLLTAALTLLAAFLLATFFAANEPRHDPDRSAAAAIAEEAVEEERIIEVDDVKLGERRAVVSAPEAEGWVEVEKAPAVVVAKEEPECSPEPDEEAEEVPVKSAPAVCAGAGLEEEDVDVAEKRTDLTAVAAATGVVVEASPQVLVAEAAPREEALDVVGREVDAETNHLHPDTGAEAAPSEVVGAHPEKQAAEVPPTKLEDVKAEVSPSAEAVDAGKEERARAIEVTPDELAVETSSGEIPDPDVVLEKKEEQIIEAKVNESTADAVPQAAHHVPLAEEELEVQQPSGLKVQQAIDKEAVNTCEEVQSREEAECETHPFHQKEESVPEEESVVATKHGAVEVSQEGISRDEVASELPVEVVTLQGPPEDDAESDIDLGEWEGIERSEVEKRFGAAAAFAASEAGVAALSKLDSDVQLQLQGLLKVAVDGPCYGSTQPLTLRPSSRAKWIAWQKLGNMHPEIAMEKYMNLLSEAIPGCLGNETADTKKHETGDDSAGAVLTMAATSDQRSHQGKEDTGIIDEGHLTASPNPEKGQGSSIPAE